MQFAPKLLFMVLLVSGLGHTVRIKRDEAHHCWNPKEMESQAKGLQKLLGRANMNQLPSVTLVKELEQQKRHGKKGCPDLRQYLTHNRDLSHRSISPWAYR
ncbi:interleukin-17C-like [Rhincodon typus]|uniref:interleukin-17C-like n=1 Tax=Rhincodon typus TaxID=259920 RepID=UPI00203032FB|nr:interleukin-17C-like [Rhincodon typus]